MRRTLTRTSLHMLTVLLVVLTFSAGTAIVGATEDAGAVDDAAPEARARPEGKVYMGGRPDDTGRSRLLLSVSQPQTGVFVDQGVRPLVRVVYIDYKSPTCVDGDRAYPGVLHIWAEVVPLGPSLAELRGFESEVQSNGHLVCASPEPIVYEDQTIDVRFNIENDVMRPLVGPDRRARLARICDRSTRGPLNVIVGDSGDNVLIGTRRADIIDARQGDDVLKGGRGNDIFCGGPGDDTIHGGKGFDVVFGQDGADDIQGSLGPDVVSGDAGPTERPSDEVRGGDGPDIVLGGIDGAVRLLGQNGADVLFVSGAVSGARLDGGRGPDGCYSRLVYARFVRCELEVGPAPTQHAALVALPWNQAQDRHQTPRAAVQAFVDYLATIHHDPSAYRNVIIGEFQGGDQTSGEVELRWPEQSSNGSSFFFPVTTVLVRKSGPADTWWVLGSIAERLVVERPEPFQTVSPQTLVAGANDTFDSVQLHVFAAGESAPFHREFLTGGGVFAVGPFRQVVPADGPDRAPGTFLFLRSDGVTVVPVTFAG